jgi:hypothetical protein
MKIQKTEEPYDNGKKTFKVIEYCCAELGREMKDYDNWEIYEDMISCMDCESSFLGRFCPYCGEKIEIILS